MSASPPTVTVFGSSKPKPGEEEYRNAYEVGHALARSGFRICSGGYGGTMEAVSSGAKDAGGKTVGVVAEFFGRTPNRFIDETIVVKTLADRLMKLVELADAYVVLKGSTGTLLELASVWEFVNKGVISEKPIVTIGGFWVPVIETFRDELRHEGIERATRFVSTAMNAEECVSILQKKLGLAGFS